MKSFIIEIDNIQYQFYLNDSPQGTDVDVYREDFLIDTINCHSSKDCYKVIAKYAVSIGKVGNVICEKCKTDTQIIKGFIQVESVNQFLDSLPNKRF